MGKKAEVPAPPGIQALQASLIQQAVAAGVVPGDRIVDLVTAQAEALSAQVLTAISEVDEPAERARLMLAMVKLGLEAQEFTRPKLARVEHKVEGALEIQHYVAVERREDGPPVAPKPLLEGEAVTDDESGNQD